MMGTNQQTWKMCVPVVEEHGMMLNKACGSHIEYLLSVVLNMNLVVVVASGTST